MRLGGKCLLLIEPLTLVFLEHSFTFYHDMLRLLMTHSRLRITHDLTNPSHAPLSLLFFYYFISHDNYSSLPHSLFDIVSRTHQECTDHVWLCLVTVNNQHSGHLTSGPLMYIRKSATLWLDSLTLISVESPLPV